MSSERTATQSPVQQSEKEKALIPEDADNTVDISSVADSELPQGRNVGLISATFLMINRIIGTGAFATTSSTSHQSHV